MTTTGPPPHDASAFDAAALRAVTTIGDGLAAAVCIARVLVEHGRTVDLTGLDRGVGLLVAKTLDLPHEQGRSLRPLLVTLRDDVDRLAAAVRSAHH